MWIAQIVFAPISIVMSFCGLVLRCRCKNVCKIFCKTVLLLAVTLAGTVSTILMGSLKDKETVCSNSNLLTEAAQYCYKLTYASCNCTNELVFDDDDIEI